MTDTPVPKGRGTPLKPKNRFEKLMVEDELEQVEHDHDHLAAMRSILMRKTQLSRGNGFKSCIRKLDYRENRVSGLPVRSLRTIRRHCTIFGLMADR
jgi:hypothetical protein